MGIGKIKRIFGIQIIIFLIISFSSFAYGFSIENEYGKLKSGINKENCVLYSHNNVTISIKGGFGLSFEICNYGDTTLYLVNWSITIDGQLILFGKSTSGSISEISPGECVTIDTVFILGIGLMEITVQIDDIIESASGYLIGPFVFLIQRKTKA